ncbi:glycine zipper 2TM domain-containing protein [Thiohalomonas denitrificans]|uniref:glycine zipper 2TM domain-containing protein n=1 Tax=Thiohalomonas denitrificans TaxID=415747 RepID=UPI0026EB4F1D|nr:glycine zipper 2TM domain-containing protein [Thiohalomonas denitrificans]
MRNRLFALIFMPLLLSGCATDGPREQAGMVIGGTLGGLLGGEVDGHGRTGAIIAGTLAGAAIGGAVGKSMDDTDRLKAAQSLENVRTGVPSAWRNPDSGVEYEFTPTRTFETRQGPCREYRVEAYVGGEKETVYGTACRQPDGSWEMVS